jgi:hypothetical protein
VTDTLDDAHPEFRRPSKALRRLAFVSLFLPLVVVGSLYGEWLLAWWSLGHAPRPSLDDPKDIAGSSWMYGITGVALVGAVHMALAALALHVADIAVNRPSISRSVVRIAVVVASWVALFALLWWDPGRVGSWWID